MITKIVSSGQRTSTAVISDETKFIFDNPWNFYHVKNLGTSVAYISMSEGANVGDDGVTAIPSGESVCTMHGYPVNAMYVSASTSTTVQVTADNSALSPFKLGKKGGGINTSDATATATDILVGKTAYIADGTKATGTAVQGIYPIGADGRPTGDVTVPIGVTSLYQYIFYKNAAITSINLPNTITSLIDNTFYGCTGLTSLVIPNSVTSLGAYCFQNCTGLTAMSLPNSITTIGTTCFSDCTNLINVNIPTSMATIPSHMFYGCTKLINTTIPANITTIGAYAFWGCTSLTAMEIPSSVAIIPTGLFFGCTKIVTIIINTVICTFYSDSFYNCTALTTFNTISGFNPTGLNMSTCTALTVDSMVAMFNNLATIGTTKTIMVGTTNLAKLSVAEKAIATGKGWTLA